MYNSQRKTLLKNKEGTVEVANEIRTFTEMKNQIFFKKTHNKRLLSLSVKEDWFGCNLFVGSTSIYECRFTRRGVRRHHLE